MCIDVSNSSGHRPGKQVNQVKKSFTTLAKISTAFLRSEYWKRSKSGYNYVSKGKIRHLCITETDTKMSTVDLPLRWVTSKYFSYANDSVTLLKMRIEDIPGPNNTPASANAIQSRCSSDFSSTSVTLEWLSKWNWSLPLISTKLNKHRTKTYPNKHARGWGNKRKNGSLHVPLFFADWSEIYIRSFKSTLGG